MSIYGILGAEIFSDFLCVCKLKVYKHKFHPSSDDSSAGVGSGKIESIVEANDSACLGAHMSCSNPKVPRKVAARIC